VKIVDIESESLAYSLIRGRKENVLIADIGSNFTNFSIFKEGILRISATVKVAGGKLSEALSKELRVVITIF